MKWKPLYDKIIIELDNIQQHTTSNGFKIVQDMSTSKYTVLQGVVVACGEGRLLADGTVKPMVVKPGYKVKFSKMQGESFTDEDKEYTILSESCILAFTEGE